VEIHNLAFDPVVGEPCGSSNVPFRFPPALEARARARGRRVGGPWATPVRLGKGGTAGYVCPKPGIVGANGMTWIQTRCERVGSLSIPYGKEVEASKEECDREVDYFVITIVPRSPLNGPAGIEFFNHSSRL